MSRRRRGDLLIHIFAITVVLLIIAAIVGIAVAVRVYAPCWMFPLREAPVRCLPGWGG